MRFRRLTRAVQQRMAHATALFDELRRQLQERADAEAAAERQAGHDRQPEPGHDKPGQDG